MRGKALSDMLTSSAASCSLHFMNRKQEVQSRKSRGAGSPEKQEILGSGKSRGAGSIDG